MHVLIVVIDYIYIVYNIIIKARKFMYLHIFKEYTKTLLDKLQISIITYEFKN